jgi:uncharacterized protein (TIGR02757 family)
MQHHLNAFLNSNVEKYNQVDFIELDPISIPHKFSRKEDIEIAGFLTSSISWGNRKAILKSANQLMNWLDNAPHDFVVNHSNSDLKPFDKFVYRTFNGSDCTLFIKSLQNIYLKHKGLEEVFTLGYKKNNSIEGAISNFRELFFSIDHPTRTQKHVANPLKGSSSKRLNMFLRWMVRKDKNGVDFGIWEDINRADLMIPLDVHSGTIARKLGLLKRNANDWKSVVELTNKLKEFDTEDPIKYDFALFGLGVNGEF